MKSMVFVLIANLGLPIFFAEGATTSSDKPKVIVQNVKNQDDIRRVLVPAKVDSKIQGLVTADFEGHIVEIVKPLGSTVKAREVILYMENREPGFSFAKVAVRAPMAGVLSQLGVSQMSKVNRGEKLFTIMNPHSLKLLVEFSARDLSNVQIGQEGKFTVDGQESPVRIVGLSPLIDPRTGTAAAELEFLPDPKKESWPTIGSIGRVQLEVSKGSVLLLPENALSYLDGKPFVRILNENNQIQRKTIDLGEQREDLFVIKSGVIPGERVVVRSSRTLKDGEEAVIEGNSEKKTE